MGPEASSSGNLPSKGAQQPRLQLIAQLCGLLYFFIVCHSCKSRNNARSTRRSEWDPGKHAVESHFKCVYFMQHQQHPAQTHHSDESTHLWEDWNSQLHSPFLEDLWMRLHRRATAAMWQSGPMCAASGRFKADYTFLSTKQFEILATCCDCNTLHQLPIDQLSVWKVPAESVFSSCV